MIKSLLKPKFILKLSALIFPLVIYIVFGHHVVYLMYYDKSTPWLNQFIPPQPIYSLNQYLRYADALFFICYSLGVGCLFLLNLLISKIGPKKLFGIFAYTAYLFLILEITMRLFFLMTDKQIEIYRNFSFTRAPLGVMPDPELGYRLIPSARRNAFTSDFKIIYQTNRLGMRDKEIEDNSLFRILFLGDSQTFAEGVEFGKRFTDYVNDEMEGVYAMNAGVPGYGMHQMYLWLKHYGLPLKPDLVMCCIIKSDLDRAVFKHLKNSPHLILQEEGKPSTYLFFASKKVGGIFNNLLRTSYFFSYFEVQLKILAVRKTLKERDRKEWEGILKRGTHHGMDWPKEKEAILKKEIFDLITNFKSLSESASFSLVIVNIDDKGALWLGDYLKEKQIAFLDLSETISKIPNRTFEIDQHYNEKTHKVIAEELKSYLLAHFSDKILNKPPEPVPTN